MGSALGMQMLKLAEDMIAWIALDLCSCFPYAKKKHFNFFFGGGAKREKTAHMETAHRVQKSDTAGRTFLNPEAERTAATPRQIHHTSASGH
jgi:hypothetical protein